MHVQLENVKDLRKQLLLMQVVKLKSGVHSVDDGVLVDKSWAGGNNSLDKGSGVSKVIHDHAARDHVVSAVHAVVESSDAVDVVILLDVEHVVGVSGLDGVGDLMDFLDGDLFLVLGFIKARHSHHMLNIKKYHHVNGVARLHYCMDRRHHMVPCSMVMDDFAYSRSLIEAIITTRPRFVHKHTVIYRMYTTLKLYYLHQQELLSEILNILKMHMHSKSLAKMIYSYISKMHGGKYGWVRKITALLKSSMKMNKN
jgi:hypothetical protein